MQSGVVSEIFEKHTQACLKFSMWFRVNFYSSETLLNKDMSNMASESLDKFIMLIMANSNPRFLYDFFDSVSVFITVRKVADGWRYLINGMELVDQSLDQRAAAEEKAFQEAFSALEKSM